MASDSITAVPPALCLGTQKHLRQLRVSDGFPVETVARGPVTSSSSSSTVDKSSLIKVFPKIAP